MLPSVARDDCGEGNRFRSSNSAEEPRDTENHCAQRIEFEVVTTNGHGEIRERGTSGGFLTAELI